MIRPERSRFNQHHPQYHTKRHIEAKNEAYYDPLDDMHGSNQRSAIRRSILAHDYDEKRAAEGICSSVDESHKRLSIWQIYCYLITCCCSSAILKVIGKKDKNAQMAFREKIGLVVIILMIMAFVGFLTFGFTQVVCPRPPLSFRLYSINNGYVIIHGWAYMLAPWNNHPPIPGISKVPTNVIYEPINAGGMDASFLFQSINGHCASVITPKSKGSVVGEGSLPSYFPCQLIDKSYTPPDPSLYVNHTACHLSSSAMTTFKELRTTGIINSEGNYDKAGRIYYDWNDVNSTSHLAVYNG
ncbi:Putative Chitin synthase [Rhizopus microsporus]|nr:Putative Chitin synthase [Rhizopus microsporus]